MNSSQKQSAADLDWMAFQYVSGDLAADDVIPFEERLANDLAACEAVARHVMICETAMAVPAVAVPAISATPPKQAPQPSVTLATSTPTISSERSASRWVGVVTAAACLGFAVWMGLFAGPSTTHQEVLTDVDDQLVQYWVDVKHDVDEPIDLLSSQADEISIWDDSDPTVSESELMPADWMLAAVSNSEMDDELDMPEEVIE